jgi:hypothetical protein
MRAPEFRLTSNVVVPGVVLGVVLDAVLPGAREIAFANDFDGLPLGLAAHTDPMRGCGTGPMGVRIS